MRRLHRDRSRPRLRRHAVRGFSLIELLVAVVIGMVLTLAITGMMIRSEGGRRAVTSTSDVATNAAYVAYVLDRTLRSAGSGYSQSADIAFGCRILASRSGTQVLPRTTAFPAPFGSVPQNVRLAPVVVHAGAGSGGSDIIAVASGSSGLGELPMRVLPGSITGTTVNIPSTVGIRAGDLVMVLQDTNNCMLQQVATGFTGGATQMVTLGGNFAANTINSINLSSMGSSSPAQLAVLGNIAGNQPQFQLLGLDDLNNLVAYDVLRLDGGDTVVPLAEGVADLRVRYGLDTNGDNLVDTWQSPATGNFTAANLLTGTAVATANLSSILALRVGLILRSTVPDREVVSQPNQVLFADLGTTLQVTRTLSADEQRLRHRTLEFTVPLRNVMMVP